MLTAKENNVAKELDVDAIRNIIATDTTFQNNLLAANEFVVYQKGNDTYLIGAGAASDDANDDIVIKLTGVKGVTSLTNDSNALTLA